MKLLVFVCNGCALRHEHELVGHAKLSVPVGWEAFVLSKYRDGQQAPQRVANIHYCPACKPQGSRVVPPKQLRAKGKESRNP